MYSKLLGDTWVLRLEIGEEVTESIRTLCLKENILCAEISGIGAASETEIGIYNTETKQYCKTTVQGPLEIVSMLGSVTQKDGEPYLHIHASFSNESCNCVGGHLNRAVIGVTAEIFIRKIEGEINRIIHPVTGINVIDL